MGTTFDEGKKPKNNITISKSSAVPRKIDPDTGKTDRSFAQPNPAVEQPAIEATNHASAQDEVEALNQNSKSKRKYTREVDSN